MDEPKILVAIRKRPLSKKEQSKCETDIIAVKNCQTVIVSEYKQKVDLTKYLEETVFNFDFAFNQQTTNQEVYDCSVRPLVNSAFEGAKITCFAYGQTGSGKTFTMNGNQKIGVRGLYTLGAIDIFTYLNNPRFRHLTARLSFFEIYCGKLFDLLNKRQQLTLREDNKQNINIIGLEEMQVDSLQRFQQLLSYGSTQRVTSQNSANAESSRSHAILQITLKEGKKIFGKISFIDLAGNERGADHTDMKKQTRIDGAEINKSLLSLKQCIRALDQGKGHTPFRGSKLTMVLKDSFVGFCRTVMIGNISPSSASSQNTLNTLRYADRVKQLRKPSQGLTKQELKAREMMLPRQNNNAIKIDITKDDDAQDIQAKRREAEKNYGIKEEFPNSQKQLQRDISNDSNRRNLDNDKSRKQSFGCPSFFKNGTLAPNQKPSQQTIPIPQNSYQNQQSINLPKSPSDSHQKIKVDCNRNSNQRNGSITEKSFQHNGNNVVQHQQHQNGYSQHEYEYQQCDYQQILSKSNLSNYNGSKGSSNLQTRMDIEEPRVIPTNLTFNKQNNNFVQQNSQTQRYNNNNNVNNNVNVNNRNNNNVNNNNVNNNYYNNTNNYQNNNVNNNNQINANGSVLMNSFPTQQQSASRGVSQNYGEGDRLNQYRSNYQSPQQRTAITGMQIQYGGVLHLSNKTVQQYPQPVPQKIMIPDDWDGMIEFMSSTTDPQLRYRAHQKIHQQLFHDENDLISSHSDTLRSSLDCLRSEMSLISDLQSNRDAVSTREYLQLMQQSIDEKMSLLEMLRQKMVQFTYKLERVEEIDEKSENIEPRFHEDEQLLDDLH